MSEEAGEPALLRSAPGAAGNAGSPRVPTEHTLMQKAREPWPFPTREAHPEPPAAPPAAPQPTAAGKPRLEPQHVSEDTLDEAVDETFPASDPISVGASKSVP